MADTNFEFIADWLIKHSTSSSVLINKVGEIFAINEAYAKMTGYRLEEIKQNPLIVFESEEVLIRENNLLSAVYSGQYTEVNFESTRLTKKGQLIPVEITALLFSGMEGSNGVILKRVVDISQKIHAEHITCNQLFFLKTILDEIPLSFYFKDKQSRFILNSKEHLNLIGLTNPADALGKTDFDFFSETHARKALTDEQNILKTGEHLNVVEKITDKEGRVRWAQTIKALLKDPNGEIIGTYGVTRDVTELIDAENKLHSLNEQLKDKNNQLEETINELVNTQNKLAFAEKMAALGNLIGGIAHEINTPLGAIKASSSNISNVVEKIGQDLPWLIQNASVDEIEWMFKLLTDSDEREIIVFTKEERQRKRDLTQLFENHQIENAPIVADSLITLKLDYSDEQFLAFLMQPHAQQLLSTLKTLFSMKRNTNNIQIAVEKAASVVRALKSYIYKNESGKFEATNLTDTINTVLILTANLIKHSKTNIITALKELPPVKCKQDEICQVWTNLITNAIQAIGENGTIEITGFTTENDSVIIAFKDNGPGIPLNIQERIFEPYFTTKEKGIGTGMGLDISKQIVQAHHGRIWFESTPDVGTTFFVELPINQ